MSKELSGLSPNVWGSTGWAFIHYVALGYPNEPSMLDINNYKNFYFNIGHVLPCDTCKKHYNTMIAELPPNTQNQDTLFKWTVDIHNKVNQRLNKNIISYHEATDIWKNQTKNNASTYQYPIYIYIVIIVLLILLLTKWSKLS